MNKITALEGLVLIIYQNFIVKVKFEDKLGNNEPYGCKAYVKKKKLEMMEG